MAIKISLDEYKKIKKSVEALPWIWLKYETECPNDWYHFKYESEILKFMNAERGDKLIERVKYSWNKKKIKLNKQDYIQLKDFAQISYELQDILTHPPYGSKISYETEQASRLISSLD